MPTTLEKKPAPSRRRFLKTAPLLAGAMLSAPLRQAFAQATVADRNIRITGMQMMTLRVSERTNWILVQLNSSAGITGLGEASLGRRSDLPELIDFYELVDGASPFAVNEFRRRGRTRAAVGQRPEATAFSAIEQALWDMSGKILDAPYYDMVGGSLQQSLPLYANINRATRDRSPEGFAANARAAAAEGFSAIKAAPFDGFPSLDADPDEIDAARELGVACVYAMREAVGPDVEIRIDAHSFFDVELAVAVAQELEGAALAWYEEPVAPTQIADTRRIHDAIAQPLAGGEFLFGVEGFWPLCSGAAVDIIMPDVKHCGGMLEAAQIAALAGATNIKVSPHNPSGPVSTAASAALCTTLSNFDILEYQWGEADWRSTLLRDGENITAGRLAVSDAAGLGTALNEEVLVQHLL